MYITAQRHTHIQTGTHIHRDRHTFRETDTLTHNDTHTDRQTQTHIHTIVTYHSEEGDGSGGMVVDGNKVGKKFCSTDHDWEETSSTEHLLNPFFTWRRECVHVN